MREFFLFLLHQPGNQPLEKYTPIDSKWKVLILRDLRQGTLRFGQLQRSIGSVSATKYLQLSNISAR
ncbi:winged helix-turn-helix transcriptional regulator [Allobaculum sp. JKK-2023]|uniref:winged helix-turn-helix transcriptional regulator n=1 Tax=Allobaculum sp. JKK-2023 TaxID=3108943 RepID=UPI002B0621F3|nr:winged helix-turn-helix transcriptional regulator [Allobaculum sp. JKK-2023]